LVGSGTNVDVINTHTLGSVGGAVLPSDATVAVAAALDAIVVVGGDADIARQNYLPDASDHCGETPLLIGIRVFFTVVGRGHRSV
jgi:hypothetical protein